jgi:hypothetical protein
VFNQNNLNEIQVKFNNVQDKFESCTETQKEAFTQIENLENLKESKINFGNLSNRVEKFSNLESIDQLTNVFLPKVKAFGI